MGDGWGRSPGANDAMPCRAMALLPCCCCSRVAGRTIIPHGASMMGRRPALERGTRPGMAPSCPPPVLRPCPNASQQRCCHRDVAAGSLSLEAPNCDSETTDPGPEPRSRAAFALPSPAASCPPTFRCKVPPRPSLPPPIVGSGPTEACLLRGGGTSPYQTRRREQGACLHESLQSQDTFPPRHRRCKASTKLLTCYFTHRWVHLALVRRRGSVC